MESILILSRLFLAAIFATAGIAKLLDLKGSETAVRDFGVHESLVKPFSFILPICEIVIALLFFPVASSWFGAVASLTLLIGFNVGMGYQMAKGNAPNCHCFGQLHTEPVSAKSLIRNTIFAVPALFLVLRGVAAQGPSFAAERIYTTEFVFGVLILAALAGMLLFLKNILDMQSEVLRRIEILEVIAGDGGSVERNEAGDPNDSLPIGAVLPDFELPDLKGKRITVDHLLSTLKPTLFVFVAPTCQPCRALIAELEDWIAELEGKVNFVFISRGGEDANFEKFPDVIIDRILLQSDREVQNILYARWSPSALLVNGDGRVASHVAAGDAAIRRLVAKIRSEDIDDPFFYFAIEKPHEKLPRIGEPISDFSLNDVNGRTIVSKELRGKPILATFWSLTCPHCKDMAEQIKEWEKTRGVDEPHLLLFSDGDVEEHRKVGLSSPILIDKAYGTAAKLGMSGTPSGVLIDENGRIASETAIGAANIWSLIGYKKNGR
jgi:thiol-disulfide isomerase/thioredoxin